MFTVLLYCGLLTGGLIASQLLPPALPESALDPYLVTVQFFTQLFLSYIMLHVGLEFTIDKSRLRSYGVDYLITAGAANFPWVMVVLYIGLLIPPETDSTGEAWKQTLLLARFVAPTSAGVLFSMLAAADLQDTWLFGKARIIAVFDDLDTIIWLIPLKLIITGFQWEAIVVVFVMLGLLTLAWFQLHKWRLPATWPWACLYAVVITGTCQALALITDRVVVGVNGIVIEVLLPSFAFGACILEPNWSEQHQAVEEKVAVGMSAVFLLLVGLSIPPFFMDSDDAAALNWGEIVGHVVAISILMNIGKMFPSMFYREEASTKERVALGIGIFPRGEVGAGILIVAVSLGVTGVCVLISALALALNLILIGAYVYIVKYLLMSSRAVDGARGADYSVGTSEKQKAEASVVSSTSELDSGEVKLSMDGAAPARVR